MSLKRKASNSESSRKKAPRSFESRDTANLSANDSQHLSLPLTKLTQTPPNTRRTSSKELSSEFSNTRSAGADVNAYDANGLTSLHMAVAANDIDTVHRLLLANADIAVIDATGRTPLAVAVMEGNQQATALLLVAKADPGQCLSSGVSLLKTAITCGQVSTAKILLTSLLYQSIDTKPQWMRPRMSLFTAVPDIESLFDEILRKNNVVRKDIGWCTVEELENERELENSSSDSLEDADPELSFSDRRQEFIYILEKIACHLPMGVRALHTACAENNLLAFTGCLTTHSARASVVSDEERGEMVLVSAVESHNSMLVRLASLVQPNVNICDNRGKCPLLRAAKAGDVDVVRILLNSNADINFTSTRKKNALMYAAESNHANVAQLLLSQGISPQAVDGEGWTAVMYASRQGSVEVLDLLIAARADVNVVRVPVATTGTCTGGKMYSPKFHGTALRLAVEKGHTEVVRMLLCAKASLDGIIQVLPSDGAAHAVTDTVESPLLIAVQRGYTEVVKLILDQKQDHDYIRRYSKSLLRAAAIQNHPLLVRLLVSASADVDAGYELGQSALLTAVNEGHVSVLKALIDCNADVDACGENGLTALMIACAKGDEKAVRVLIGAGACVNMVDNTNGTALMDACAAGNIKIVQLLLTVGADVDAVDNDGKTVLQAAHVHRHQDLMRCLFLTLCYKLFASQITLETTSEAELELKFHISYQKALNRAGLTEDELSYVLNEGVKDVMCMSLDRWGECISDAHQKGDGYTPLMIASAEPYPTLITAMVCAGADVMCVNNDGEQAIDIARSQSRQDIAEVRKIIQVLEMAEENTLLRKKSIESRENMLKIRVEKLRQRGVDVQEKERREREEREKERALEEARLQRLREEEELKRSQQIKKKEWISGNSNGVKSTREQRSRRRSSILEVKLEE